MMMAFQPFAVFCMNFCLLTFCLFYRVLLHVLKVTLVVQTCVHFLLSQIAILVQLQIMCCHRVVTVHWAVFTKHEVGEYDLVLTNSKMLAKLGQYFSSKDRVAALCSTGVEQEQEEGRYDQLWIIKKVLRSGKFVKCLAGIVNSSEGMTKLTVIRKTRLENGFS